MQAEAQVRHLVKLLEVKMFIQIDKAWYLRKICMKIEIEFDNNSWFAKPVDSVCRD
jgi:hypothetical protein